MDNVQCSTEVKRRLMADVNKHVSDRRIGVSELEQLGYRRTERKIVAKLVAATEGRTDRYIVHELKDDAPEPKPPSFCYLYDPMHGDGVILPYSYERYVS